MRTGACGAQGVTVEDQIFHELAVWVYCTDEIVADAKMLEFQISHYKKQELEFMVGEDRASRATETHRAYDKERLAYRIDYFVP